MSSREENAQWEYFVIAYTVLGDFHKSINEFALDGWEPWNILRAIGQVHPGMTTDTIIVVYRRPRE